MASSSNDSPVHQLWPPSGGKQRTELDVVFFHGFQLTANATSDAWSSTWTQRGRGDVCWPREWLPFDLGEAVRIFSVSYNADLVDSPHDHVFGIAHNVFQNLMSPRYNSPLSHFQMACLGKCSGFVHNYMNQLTFPDIRFVTQPCGLCLSVVLNQLIKVDEVCPEE
jgi:hypothetical protein